MTTITVKLTPEEEAYLRLYAPHTTLPQTADILTKCRAALPRVIKIGDEVLYVSAGWTHSGTVIGLHDGTAWLRSAAGYASVKASKLERVPDQ